MEVPRQEYWSELPFSSPGDLSNSGTKLAPPALQVDSLLLRHQGSPHNRKHTILTILKIRVSERWDSGICIPFNILGLCYYSRYNPWTSSISKLQSLLEIHSLGFSLDLNQNLHLNRISRWYRLPWWLRSKEPACQCRRHGFDPWVRKIPRGRKWEPIPVFLPGKSHGQRSLVGYSPWGCK